MRYFIPHDSIDCGPACLKMIADHYGRNFSFQFLRRICNINRLGVSLYNLEKAAIQLGFKTVTAQLSLNYLVEKAELPCILFWDTNHFVVLYKVSRGKKRNFFLMDPGQGKIMLDEQTFSKYWLNNDAYRGFALFLHPTTDFRTVQETADPSQQESSKKSGFAFLSRYFLRFKGNYLQVFFAMGVTAMTSFLFPFLTQSIVDSGVRLKDINFVVLILFFQLFLFITSTVADVVRSHLLLHISSRINISILSDFLGKMMNLPMKFFESKMPGDLVQRIQDHGLIEEFITSTLLTSIFTVINLVVYSYILFFYSSTIFLVFIIGSILSLSWTMIFLRWRKALNYLRFQELSNTNDKLFEMANYMPEIKINRFEKYKKWEWEGIRVKLFRLETSKLSLEQYQRIGSDFFDQIRTIIVLFLSVYGVIKGDLSLGMMLAISYIIGQLNSPIRDIIRLINTFQTASIGLERMNEVYSQKDEVGGSIVDENSEQPDTFKGIEFKDLSFSYAGSSADKVLKEVNIKLPRGKVTAIVGTSGSGKTTILKLLLRFYEPDSGEILLNGQNLASYSIDWWRDQCGVVMQEGHIFSDTIRRNIVMGDDSIDNIKLVNAVGLANIEDFILELPLHFETKVGDSGLGMSTGQKQRLLIARAVYKNPSYLFLDEATSSLDAENERVIMENFVKFSGGKTVVIIAHRLSTVKNADQIVVMEKGRVVEVGNHVELISRKGSYFNLVKNQLELSE